MTRSAPNSSITYTRRGEKESGHCCSEGRPCMRGKVARNVSRLIRPLRTLLCTLKPPLIAAPCSAPCTATWTAPASCLLVDTWMIFYVG